MFPQAGGQYVYLREAYGHLVSFLCGWTFFLAVQSGGISTVAVGFAQYLADFFPISPAQQKLAASLSIVVLTAINYRGVREAGWLQSVLTGAKVGAMVALVALGYALVHGPVTGAVRLPTPAGWGFLSSFGVAMVAALWAYDGWNNGTFAGDEVKNPERNIPLGLILGTGGVVVIYVLLNLVYYHLLPLSTVAQSPRVAAEAGMRLFGRAGDVRLRERNDPGRREGLLCYGSRRPLLPLVRQCSSEVPNPAPFPAFPGCVGDSPGAFGHF
jgi:APA family basic amino acid/polyamine antiporter